jgi:cytochrome P450
MERTSFIRMDPPEHDEQRREVSSTVNPVTLAKMEDLIRSRTNMVLDKLPRNEPFNWVEHVSIELTSMMLATLFDYPIDDKLRLIRWSDMFICDINAPDAPVKSEEERFAKQMEFAEKLRRDLDPGARRRDEEHDVAAEDGRADPVPGRWQRYDPQFDDRWAVGFGSVPRSVPETAREPRADHEPDPGNRSLANSGDSHAPHRDRGFRTARPTDQGR